MFHQIIRSFFPSAADELKLGKTHLFWGLDSEFEAVSVVGLGKQKEGYDDLELIHADKESVRIAASGKIAVMLTYLLLKMHYNYFSCMQRSKKCRCETNLY